MHIADASITKVVTDPPWGEYDDGRKGSIRSLYSGFLRQLERVLASDGVAVLLLGRNSAFFDLLRADRSKFLLGETHEVLVSGTHN